MEYSIDMDRTRGLITVSARGDATAADFQSYIADLLKPPCSEVDFNVLSDLRNVNMGTLSGDDVRDIARLVATRRSEVLTIKHAIVVGGPLSFGLARMYQTLSDDVDPQDLRIFYDIDEARRWLSPEAGG